MFGEQQGVQIHCLSMIRWGESDSDGQPSDDEPISSESLESDLELKLQIMGSKQLFTETSP